MTMFTNRNDDEVFFENVDFFGPTFDTFEPFFARSEIDIIFYGLKKKNCKSAL